MTSLHREGPALGWQAAVIDLDGVLTFTARTTGGLDRPATLSASDPLVPT